MFRILFLYGLIGLTADVSAKAIKYPQTIPMPPKRTYDPMARLSLANEVPNPLDSYKYALIGEFDGKVYYASAVPVYKDNDDLTAVKTLPVGSEVTPTHILRRYGRHYYGFADGPAEKANNGPTHVLWIDGRFIKATKK